MNPSHRTPRLRCAYCYEPYVRQHPHQKYCSKICAHDAKYGPVGDRIEHGFDHNIKAVQDSVTAERVIPRPVEIRRVKAGDGKRYYARDADALLEEISESEQARPGLLYG